jgi:Protein of unknown function (DUF4244)
VFPQPQPAFLDDFTDDSGMATPEASILIIVGAVFAGLLLWAIQSAEVREALVSMIHEALESPS